MTREEVIEELNAHLIHWKRLLREKICSQEDGKKTINALEMAIEALEQEQDILFKIFCIVDPLSIMSTTELEHKAIMQIAEMLEPLCLPESEDKE